jgi:hypothetical protein
MISCIFFLAYLQKTLTLDMQIKLFKRVIQNNLAKIFNEKEKLEKHISESLFIVSSGVNDHFLSRGNFRGSRKFEFHLLREFFLHLQVCVTYLIVIRIYMKFL